MNTLTALQMTTVRIVAATTERARAILAARMAGPTRTTWSPTLTDTEECTEKTSMWYESAELMPVTAREARVLMRLIGQERLRQDGRRMGEATTTAQRMHHESADQLEATLKSLCDRLHAIAPEGV